MAQEDKNYVLIVKYECGEAGYLTNQPDLLDALNEYNEMRKKQMQDFSKSCPMPLIKEAYIHRLFRDI